MLEHVSAFELYFENFQRGVSWHKVKLQKLEAEKAIVNNGLHSDQYADSWAILVNKAY